MLTTKELINQWDADWAARFPMRLTGGQKERFLTMLAEELQARQFEVERFTVGWLRRNRLLATRCERPSIIFLAHYDTPTIMPFWADLFFRWWGHTRQLSGAIVLPLALLAPIIIIQALFNPDLAASLTVLWQAVILLSTLTMIIPNPRNREDNSSGVIGLLALADWLKDKPEIRDRVQFAFLDNEEWGLLGSAALKRLWRKNGHPYAEANIINLDCISRGQKPLLVYHKHGDLARQLLPYVQAQFPQAETIDMGVLPLSDNYTFRQVGAVNISFADSSLIPGGYFIPRIHTPADNDLDAAKLAALLEGLIKFIDQRVSEELSGLSPAGAM